MLSLRLRPIPTFSTVDSDTPDTAMESMDMDTDSDTDTDSAMVSYGKRSADAKADPYLLYGGLGYTGYGLGHLGYLDTISDTDTDSAMVSITASRLHQDLSVNQLGQKWIVISLNFPSPVLQFQ